jgi:hypothetical protein
MKLQQTSSGVTARALLALLLLGAVVLLQYASGAYHGEFGSHPDEAAHVVTGLMVYDYLTSFDWASPLRFAEIYYLHYPKVSLGHWPPVFYLEQALWMVFFGASRVSLLLLMASLCTLVAWTIYRVARQFSQLPFALLAAGVFILHPIVQQSTAAVMAEIPLTYCMFLATLVLGRYLERQQKYDAVLFGLLASLAILTKASGLLLALLPVMSGVLIRRFTHLKQPGFWLSAVIVVLLCAPFYLLMSEAMRAGMRHQSINSDFFFAALSFFSRHFVRLTEAWVIGFALVGVWNRVIAPLMRNEAVAPFWAVLASLFASTVMFHVLVPASLEVRYLAPLLPALALFVADGCQTLYQAIVPRLPLAPRWREGLVALAALLVIWSGFERMDKDWRGYGGVAAFITQSEEWAKSVMLVSSDPRGEGMLIAEVALGDNRPNRYVLRASKMLAMDDWLGRGYQKRFASSAEVMDFLARLPVHLLVIDTSLEAAKVYDHHRQLQEVTKTYPEQWRLVRQDDLVRNGQRYPAAIQVYALTGHRQLPAGDLEVNMRAVLGRTIQERPSAAPK